MQATHASTAEPDVIRFAEFLRRITGETYPEPETELHTSITGRMLAEVLDVARISPAARVLDVGCGQGPALDALRERGLSAVGITINQEDIDACRAKGHQVLDMDQSFLTFSDASFDLVWARHCVEHSIAPFFTLSGFFRVLRPGGWLYVEVPAPDTASHHELNKNHYSVLTKSSWLSLLERSGFTLVKDKAIRFQTAAGPDEYWAFLCRRPEGVEDRAQATAARPAIHLGLAQGDNYGWGVCSKYLAAELSKRAQVVQVRVDPQSPGAQSVQGTVFVALADADFNPVIDVRGTRTIAYTFFETELGQKARENAARYDMVLAGSTWCVDKLREAGIARSDVLIQGVDPELFYPTVERKPDGLFVIFSGGKFEYRKGQDLVLKAMKIVQQRHRDIVLINCWYNLWPQSVATMGLSRHISFEFRGDSWKEAMHHLYLLNGLDPARIITCPLMKNTELRDLYAKTDLGVFPNRCEGGTNLVLMEYMACGKPVVASYSTGHRDVVNTENALLVKELGRRKIVSSGKVVADWDEPSLDEFVERIEYAYQNRDAGRELGRRAGETMRRFSWGAMADTLLTIIGELPR